MVLSLEELLKAMEAFRESKKIVFTTDALTFCMLDTPTILKRQRNWGIFLL